MTEANGAVPAAARLGSLRVLVVEDNVDAAATLQEILELHGHEVSVAFSGPAGVDAARSFHPQVVLCDIGLPGMDGYEVAARLRGATETAAARLIAITGYGSDEDRRRAREVGFNHHLTKPVDPDELARVLLPPLREPGEPAPTSTAPFTRAAPRDSNGTPR